MFCPVDVYHGEQCTQSMVINIIHLTLKQISNMFMEGGICSFISTLSTKLSIAL